MNYYKPHECVFDLKNVMVNSHFFFLMCNSLIDVSLKDENTKFLR